MRIHILFTLLVSSFSGVAQEIKVVDHLSQTPIETAAVFQGSEFVLTDENGVADISDFTSTAPITVQHAGYQSKQFSWVELETANFIISLPESTLNLNEVVVSANRWEQEKSEITVQIAKISSREIAFSNPQTSADLLGLSNKVFIQKSQLGGGSPMIRGFSANRLLIVVDGVRMNNAIFRSGNLQSVISVDPNTVEDAEVVFGPGSVMYGSDALGGVIDFHTITPRLASHNSPTVKGSVMGRYGSASTEKTGHLDVQVGWEKWAAVFSFSYSDFGDLKMGSYGPDDYLRPHYVVTDNGIDETKINPDPEVQRPTGYSQKNFLQKVRYQPVKQLDITYTFQYSATSDVPRYDRLIEFRNNAPRSAQWYYGPQQWTVNNLQARWSSGSPLFDQLKIALAHQLFAESRNDRAFGGSLLRKREEKVNAISFNLDFDKQLGERQSLFYGIEEIFNSVSSTAESVDIATGDKGSLSTRYPDSSRWNSLAAYASYKLNQSEKLTWLTGLRYTKIDLAAELDNSLFPFPFDDMRINTGALNGSAGVAYRPFAGWQFNGNISTGFRAPNVDDAGKLFDSEPGNVIVPNTGLKPEYAYNFETGASYAHRNKWEAEAVVFYTILTDAMVRRDFTFNGQDSIFYDGERSNVQAIVNTNRAWIYGTQFSLSADISSHFSFNSDMTIVDGEEEDEETGERVPPRHAGPLYGSTHFVYQANRLKLDLYADYNGEIAYKDLTLSERNKPAIYAVDSNGNPYSPAWYTLNLKGSYRLGESWQINAGIENLTDQRYQPYSSGIAAPGRNFILSVRVRI